MSKIAVNMLSNANVYMDGNSLLGRAAEVELPDVKYKTADFDALGMIGITELFAGLEKMEAKIKWTSFYTEVMREAANPFKTVRLQVRSNLETFQGGGKVNEIPVVALITGTFKNLPGGSRKKGEPAQPETNFSVSYIKVTVDGDELYEIDVLQNIYKVDGKDLLETYRKNIGA